MIIKKFKTFNEAYVNKYGKLVNMDWTNEEDYKEFKKMVLSLIDETTFISKKDYYNLPLKFQELYKKLCVEKDVIFYNNTFIIEDILNNYPNECKECLVKNIKSGIIFKIYELPYYSEVIEILPLEYQKLIISTILSNSKKYYLNDNQYESFNIEVQKIIDFNKNKIIVY
jgi:hypothetical protein